LHYLDVADTTIHGRSDSAANGIIRGSKRIRSQMRIALGRARVRVAEQLADDQQTLATGCTDAGERMPQIMQTNIVKLGSLADALPDAFELHQRLAAIAAYDERIVCETRNRLQYCRGGCVEADRFLPGLAIRKQQQAPLCIQVVPA